MTEENLTWEEIARAFGKEKDPRRRKELERNLGIALERAGFQNFSFRKRLPQQNQGPEEK